MCKFILKITKYSVNKAIKVYLIKKNLFWQLYRLTYWNRHTTDVRQDIDEYWGVNISTNKPKEESKRTSDEEKTQRCKIIILI